MGCDEYHPLTRKGSNLTDSGGIGYTIIDAIDTIWLMGLDDEYSRARDWIDTELTFDRHGNYNTFEVCARVHFATSFNQSLDNNPCPWWPPFRLPPFF
jgi:hypothetical protein